MFKRTLKLGLILVIGSATATASCKNDKSDNDTMISLAAIALFLPQNQGTCAFTFGSSSVNIQEYNLTANSNSSFSTGFTYAFRYWAALKLPSVANGTTVAFSYKPFYPSST